jgi:hypothetical protein
MFAIHCNHCQKRYLVSTSAIESFANTEHGPEAIAHCPKGHAVVHDFHTESSRPLESALTAA